MSTGKQTEIFLQHVLLHGEDIWKACAGIAKPGKVNHSAVKINMVNVTTVTIIHASIEDVAAFAANPDNAPQWYVNIKSRSEERRVGKECRSRWERYKEKKKKRE